MPGSPRVLAVCGFTLRDDVARLGVRHWECLLGFLLFLLAEGGGARDRMGALDSGNFILPVMSSINRSPCARCCARPTLPRAGPGDRMGVRDTGNLGVLAGEQVTRVSPRKFMARGPTFCSVPVNQVPYRYRQE